MDYTDSDAASDHMQLQKSFFLFWKNNLLISAAESSRKGRENKRKGERERDLGLMASLPLEGLIRVLDRT